MPRVRCLPPLERGAESAESRMPAPARSPRLVATVALLLVTVIWGYTFVWMQEAIRAGREVLGPGHDALAIALFIALRFGLAAVGTAVVLPGARRALGRPGVGSGGFTLGVILFLGFLGQLGGLTALPPSTSAFLTSLYVVVTALLGRLGGGRLGPLLLLGVGLATAGAAFIDGLPHLRYGLAEWVTVASSVVFALHILVTDRVTRRASPEGITLTCFLWTAFLATLLALVLGGPTRTWAVAGALLADADFLRVLLLCAVLGNMVALTVMNRFQRELPPVRAAIVYALEPVWATVGGLLAGVETLDGWLFLGGGLLLAGNLVAELGGRAPAPAGTKR